MKTKQFLLVSLFCMMFGSSWAGTIPMQLVNNSQFADNEIYVAIIGQSNGTWVYYDLAKNWSGYATLTPLSTSLNTLHKTSSDWGYANIFTTLDKISNKTINLTQTNACRVFFGFKSPLYLHAFDSNGGFAGADFQNVSDPNHGIRWELIEFTLNQNAIYINTSRVDAFQYPMGLELYGGSGANNPYMKRGEMEDYSTIINRWKSTNGSNQFNACYQQNITADGLGGIIVQPSKVASIKNNGYFNDYINRIWSHYSYNQLYADMGQLGKWRGGVSGDVFTMTRESDGAVAKIYSKPSTTDVIEGAGAFAKGGELDKAMQAMFCGAINRGVIDLSVASGQIQYWGDTNKFFSTDVYNPYVKFFHQKDLSYNGYTYAFAYDDTFDQSSTCATSNPDHCVVTIGGFNGSSDTGGTTVPTVAAAPVPSQSASNVKSLYSDAYTSVAQSWSVGSWYQSTKTSEVELASGDKAYCNTNFNYVGFQFGSDSQTVDMSDMDHMHLDIYPTADMTINIYPITKRADWTTNDTQKFARTLVGGKWNSIDLNVSDFKAAGLDVSKSYQIKLDGGNGGNTFYLDNIYYWKETPKVAAAPVPSQSASNVKSLYSDAYTSVAQSWSVGSWYQSTKTSQVELASGDKAYCNTNFNYVGFQFGSDSQTVDMSDMDHMHLDIYPTADMTINIYPITKRADWTTNDTQKFARTLVGGKWNSIDLNVSDFKAAGLDVSKSYQIKLDGGNGSNTFYLDNIYYWKETPKVAAAPVPSQSASNVKSLYSDAYTSVAQSWSVGSWYQSTKTSQVELASGDKAYCNTNFNYVGFQFGSDSQTVDMSDMDHMHLDIYPTADMTINIYPITKRADWTTDDTQKFARTLEGGKWNSIDLNVSDFKAAGLDVSKSYQIKLDGGDGNNTFYLDNIYYWKEASVSGIPAAPVPTIYSSYVKSLYSDAYTSVAKDWKVGSWYQSTKTTEVQLASGDKAYCNTDFNYLGFQFGGDNDVIDVSSMFFLHFDIYPLSDMTINVYPITKKSDGSTDDTQRLSYTVTKGGWNQVNVYLPYFKNLGMDLSKNFQIKLDGGDGTQSFYLDNIYYWSYFSAGAKGNGATGITDMDASTDAKTFDVYSVDGQLVKQAATSLEGLSKGIYIVNGKKMIAK